MDCTTLALNLINAYKKEHNRMRRARALKYRVRSFAWEKEMCLNEFLPQIPSSVKLLKHTYKHTRRFFINAQSTERANLVPQLTAFVSHSVKRGAIRDWELKIARAENGYYINKPATDTAVDYLVRLRNELAIIKSKPVLTKLGKIWQQYVDACKEEYDANEARWHIRCAIKAFNQMNTGIMIKFGNCGKGGGSMSYINHVAIDGVKIKLAKFLDNAEFESVFLNAE